MEWAREIEFIVRKYALQNSLEYNGKGKSGSVLGRILSERTDLREKARSLKKLVEEEVEEANKIAKNQGLEVVKEILEELAPDALVRKKQVKNTGLKELPGDTSAVILRFAPNPNGPLSLGHSRGVIINSEYAKLYGGKVVLRFDDTDTKIKPPILEAYQWIIDEYEWLTGKSPDVIVRASERMDIYLDYAEKILKADFAYVCNCTQNEFKRYRVDMEPCPCRINSVSDNISAWDEMIAGKIDEGSAIVRIKTDMKLPNPALRDWPALRIQKAQHPIVGSKYHVWPLLDFQSAVEDYEQGITHIIRGKDLMDSTRKQTILYEKMGWKYPETLYWGRVKLLGFGKFSTSEMRSSIENGEYEGWNELFLPTIGAIRRRGFSAESIKRYWLELGLTQKDISVPMKTIESVNSKIIDKKCERRIFVENPVEFNLNLQSKNESKDEFPVSILLEKHPEIEMGHRRWIISDRIFLGKDDSNIESLRLKGLADVKIEFDKKEIELESIEKSDDRSIVHWLPVGMQRDAILVSPKEGRNSVIHGLIEDFELIEGEVYQFERLGFARVEENMPESPVKLVWLHN